MISTYENLYWYDSFAFSQDSKDYKLSIQESCVNMIFFVQKYIESCSHFHEETFKINNEDIRQLMEPLLYMRGRIEKALFDEDRQEILNILYKMKNGAQISSETSKILTSPSCKKAHDIDSISVDYYYSCVPTFNPNTHSISLGFPPIFEKTLEEYYNNFGTWYYARPKTIYMLINQVWGEAETYCSQLKLYFSQRDMANSIFHELSHWLNDTLHNQFVPRTKGDLKNHKDLSGYFHVPDMVFSSFELDAYIHGLKMTKEYLGEEEWNTLTIPELFQKDAGLYVVQDKSMKSSESKQAFNTFKQRLISRMNREGLLGDNMKNNTKTS